jgi:hypothetical protein
VVPAAPLPTHPLLTWLRLRFSLRRALTTTITTAEADVEVPHAVVV